jgi:hypothetical protein
MIAIARVWTRNTLNRPQHNLLPMIHVVQIHVYMVPVLNQKMVFLQLVIVPQDGKVIIVTAALWIITLVMMNCGNYLSLSLSVLRMYIVVIMVTLTFVQNLRTHMDIDVLTT